MSTRESRLHRIPTSQDNEPCSTWQGHENSRDAHAPAMFVNWNKIFKVNA